MKIDALGFTYVKCTAFRNVQRTTIGKFGIPNDRKFLLLNSQNKPVPAQDRGPLMRLAFDFEEDEKKLILRYPDGRVISEDLILADEVTEIDYLGLRSLQLREVLGSWALRLSEFAGERVTMHQCEKPGDGNAVFPISLVTTGALAELERRIGTPLDARRFRANLVIDNGSRGQEEDDWDGRLLRAGTVTLKVRSSIPRCIVTHFNPDDGRNDADVLRVLHQYRSRVHLPDGLMPQFAAPGFASYAEVLEPGEMRVGDTAEVI